MHSPHSLFYFIKCYKIFIEKKFSIRDILVLLFYFTILTVVKSYISVIILAGLFAIIFFKIFGSIKIMVFRFIAVIVFLGTLTLIIFSIDFSEYIRSVIQDSVKQIQVFQQSYQNVQEMDDTGSGATFSISGFDASLKSLIVHFQAVCLGSKQSDHLFCITRSLVHAANHIICFNKDQNILVL